MVAGSLTVRLHIARLTASRSCHCSAAAGELQVRQGSCRGRQRRRPDPAASRDSQWHGVSLAQTATLCQPVQPVATQKPRLPVKLKTARCQEETHANCPAAKDWCPGPALHVTHELMTSKLAWVRQAVRRCGQAHPDPRRGAPGRGQPGPARQQPGVPAAASGGAALHVAIVSSFPMALGSGHA